MRITAVIPAYNNQTTIAASVRALLETGRVDTVVVVDDASADQTGAHAEAAGASVVRLARNRGKRDALLAGFESTDAEILLMTDGDTGSSAAEVVALADFIRNGEADMVVGVLPSADGKGGFGIVQSFARWCIRRTSGFSARAPLSGQRALRRGVFETCGLSGKGFAIDSRLTMDAVLHGFRVTEKEVAMTHDHRGRTIAGFVHRARQGLHIARSFLPYLLRLRRRPGR